MKYLLWVVGMLIAGQGFAYAQGLGSSGGVVRGNTEINANAQNVNTIAVGSGNTAKTNIGTVRGNVRESTKVTVDVKNVTNVVGGHGRKGCINIGTKGTDPDCQ